MNKATKLPKGYHTIMPYLIIKGAAAAIEFYRNAFGAKEKGRITTPDGKIGHAESVTNGPLLRIRKTSHLQKCKIVLMLYLVAKNKFLNKLNYAHISIANSHSLSR